MTEPVLLPAEPTPEMLVAMANAKSISMEHRYRALYAHLTKPKTKPVWEVRYSGGCWIRYYTRAEALVNADRRLQEGHRIVEIQEREVPA